ncbi:grasp-with-spasm system SPASM domain peptide maturase [Flavobacterium sp. UW10123]|uniref:grasp-with-spasm system SPASM domain peptide maturase n=1 Tax=Flavobacterium sp. UW10123 TaxID=3230800 RepID=UPI003398DFBE
MRNKQFNLFQCCKPVKGIKKGIIVDLQRKIIHKVPNQILDILEEYSQKNIYDLFADFNASKDILKSYIRYFIDNELVILSDNISEYPALSEDFLSPTVLESLSIEIENWTHYLDDFFKIKVNQLGLDAIKIIIKNTDIECLANVIGSLETSKVKAVVLYIEYSSDNMLKIEPLILDNPRILNVVFYNVTQQINQDVLNEKFSFDKAATVQEILYRNTIQDQNSFVLDVNLYHEALKHNLMFNRTLYIDSSGNIKLHGEDLKIYGNIQKQEITEIIEHVDFKLFWSIGKDQTQVCKNCEFRYICPDNRIPYKESPQEFEYKFKTKCNYDPYQGKWNY